MVPREGRRGAVLPFSGGVDAGFALAAHASRVLGRLNQDVTRAVLILGWDLREGRTPTRCAPPPTPRGALSSRTASR